MAPNRGLLSPVIGPYTAGGHLHGVSSLPTAPSGPLTQATETLLDTTIQAHADNGLTLDFAMGPATGDGVPAIQGQEGLAWDLSMNTATVDASHAFNGTLPGWGSGELQGVVTGVVVGTVNVSGSQPGLPNSNSAAHQQITLSASSLQDITSMVGSDGHLTISFSSDTSTSQRLIFAVYLYHTNGTVVASPSNLLGPQTPPTNYVQNGSWIVDHFSAAGAKVVTDFWEQNLLTNGTKEALMHVGHVGWEDSVEILENIYWTEELPTKFQQQHNYSITQWYPILFHQNDYSSPSTWYITDEPDSGNSHVADYRNTVRFPACSSRLLMRVSSPSATASISRHSPNGANPISTWVTAHRSDTIWLWIWSALGPSVGGDADDPTANRHSPCQPARVRISCF